MRYRTAAVFLFTLALASAAVAQDNPAAKPTDSGIMDTTLQVTGTVLTSEANRLIVKADNGQEMVFIITDKQVDASMFHPGDRVTASYITLAGTGAVVTKVVTVPVPVTPTVTTYTPPPAAPKATPPAPKPYVAPAPAPAPAPVTTAAPVDVLPTTASPMPLVALLGLLGVAGAATVRRFRRS